MAKNESKTSRSALAEAFIEDVWGERSRGMEIPSIEMDRPVRHSDVEYVLSRYPYLQMLSLNQEDLNAEQLQLRLVKSVSGWVIHDYGDAMSSSPGEKLYGTSHWTVLGQSTAEQLESSAETDLTRQEDAEGGSGDVWLSPGSGTVVNQAVLTAQEMVELAMERGWMGVDIVAGHALMKWAVWARCEDLGFALRGYQPSEDDKRKYERAKRQVAAFSSSSRPKRP